MELERSWVWSELLKNWFARFFKRLFNVFHNIFFKNRFVNIFHTRTSKQVLLGVQNGPKSIVSGRAARFLWWVKRGTLLFQEMSR